MDSVVFLQNCHCSGMFESCRQSLIFPYKCYPCQTIPLHKINRWWWIPWLYSDYTGLYFWWWPKIVLSNLQIEINLKNSLSINEADNRLCNISKMKLKSPSLTCQHEPIIECLLTIYSTAYLLVWQPSAVRIPAGTWALHIWRKACAAATWKLKENWFDRGYWQHRCQKTAALSWAHLLRVFAV